MADTAPDPSAPAQHAPGAFIVVHLRSGPTVAQVVSQKGRRVVTTIGGGIRCVVDEGLVHPHTKETGLVCERRRAR